MKQKKIGESMSDVVIGKHGGILGSYLSLVGKDGFHIVRCFPNTKMVDGAIS